jgi:hypothetical protein
MKRLRWRADLVLSLAGGLVLAAFGLRQAVASFLLMPAAATLQSLQEMKPVEPAALDGLIADQTASLAVAPNAAGWSNLSLALALRQQDAAAESALLTSLSLAPANPYGWLRLAVLRDAANAPETDVLAAWRLSQWTGPNEVRLRQLRIRLAVAHWSGLAEADRRSLFMDIRHEWDHDQSSVFALATTPIATNIIRAALVIDMDAFTTFEHQMAAREVNHQDTKASSGKK